jgi:glycosyltransferase involved in cell wall biosynthesis
MHILFVENAYPNLSGEQGGAGTYVRNVGLELIKRGHKVSVLMGGNHIVENEYRIDQGIKVYTKKIQSHFAWYVCKIPVINKLFFPLIQYFVIGLHKFIYIKKIHKKDRIDIIEYSSTGDFWQCIFKSIPYIVHLHGSGNTLKLFLTGKISIGEKLLNRFECFFYTRARVVFSPSLWMLKRTENEIRGKFQNSHVLKYPISKLTNINSFQNFGSKKIKFFMAARNDETKGWNQLLKAIDLLNKKYLAKSEFIFFGYKPIDKNKILKNIKIYSFSKRNIILENLMKSNVAIVPSHVDNSPNTIYEAMSFSKPVIGSNLAGIPELIRHKKTGLLINPFDHHEFSKAIIYMINHPRKVEEFGKNAFKYITRNCSIEKNVDYRLQYWSK